MRICTICFISVASPLPPPLNLYHFSSLDTAIFLVTFYISTRSLSNVISVTIFLHLVMFMYYRRKATLVCTIYPCIKYPFYIALALSSPFVDRGGGIADGRFFFFHFARWSPVNVSFTCI